MRPLHPRCRDGLRRAGHITAVATLTVLGLALAACGDPPVGVHPDTAVDISAIIDRTTVGADVAADATDAPKGPEALPAVDGVAPPDIPVDVATAGDVAALFDVADASAEATATVLPECTTAVDCATLGSAGSCAQWACSQTGTCVAAAAAAGTPCGASGGCVQWSCASDGACSVPTVLVCPSGACLVGACDVASGACSLAPTPTATACSDGDACTTGDACDGKGGCAAGLALACTATVCQTATCDPVSGACVALPVATTTACDDGEPCTTNDLCAQGQCQAGAWTCACKVSVDCEDSNPCTVAACAAGSCIVTALDATPCDDGSLCTANDSCTQGVCLPGTATNCDDANVCTTDACIPLSGACTYTAVQASPCDDGNLCSVGDSCAAGSCKAGGPADCDDGNPCSDDACAPTSGQCLHVPASPKACGPSNVCAVGSCACALGIFAVPTLGSEHLRSVAAAPFGFVAVGDSVTAAGLRGLAVAVDLANAPVYVRRLGGSAATSFAAVIADSNGVRLAVTSQLDHADLARLDSLGNIAKQVVVFKGAEAQALLGLDDGGALFLATDLWATGGSVRLARLSSTDAVLWTTALAPPDADQVARASDLVLLTSGVVVPGQHHAFGAPQQTQPWLARFALADGQNLGLTPLLALPPSAQAQAAVVAANQLWIAGESLGMSGGAWLARAELDAQGLPQAATVVANAAGPAAWSGLAAMSDGVVMAGYQTGDGLDFALRRQSLAGSAWTLAAPAKGKQLLQGVAVLLDGTLVAVGGREIKGGGEAVWVRVAGDGAQGCL